MNQEERVWLYRNNLFWLAYSMGVFFLLYHDSQTYGSKDLNINKDKSKLCRMI